MGENAMKALLEYWYKNKGKMGEYKNPWIDQKPWIDNWRLRSEKRTKYEGVDFAEAEAKVLALLRMKLQQEAKLRDKPKPAPKVLQIAKPDTDLIDFVDFVIQRSRTGG